MREGKRDFCLDVHSLNPVQLFKPCLNFDNDLGTVEPEAQDVSATSSIIELELEGLCLQSDTFDSSSSYSKRLAISMRNLEVRDCRPKSDFAPGWQKIFGQFVSRTSPRDNSNCLISAELESVRPDGCKDELRLKVSSLPLRLRLDQDIVTYLQGFFGQEPYRDTLAESFEEVTADSGDLQIEEPVTEEVFFQRCEIRSITIVVDYKPRRLDVAALRAGNLVEVMNITAWSDIRLQLPHVRLMGVHGWHTVGSQITQKYVNNIASSQVHSFVAGIKPLQSIMRIGSAAGQLLAIPADALRSRPESAARPKSDNVPISRQLQRGIFALVRAIIAETLGISAGALGGLQLVLSGQSPRTSSSQAQPQNVAEGMRQASRRLSAGVRDMGSAFQTSEKPTPSKPQTRSSGFGSAAARALRAAPGAIAKPLSEGAAAARLTILGAKNSLDPQQYEKKRQER